MINSNNQNQPFSLSQLYQFDNENINRLFSSEEENESIISDNIDVIPRQYNILSITSNSNIEEDISLNFFFRNNISEDSTEKDQINFIVIKGTKRGRKNYKKNLDEKKKIHDKNSSDNLLRKIQNHYLTFIISFMNEIFQSFNIKPKLRGLDYKFKSNVNKQNVNYLKNSNIRDIICHEISNKYKRKRDINNESICKNIKNIVLEKILSENYLILFRKFYYNESNIINLKDYGLDKDIILSDKVKLFKDFQEINSNNEYRINIVKCVKKHFFTSLFNVEKKKEHMHV